MLISRSINDNLAIGISGNVEKNTPPITKRINRYNPKAIQTEIKKCSNNFLLNKNIYSKIIKINNTPDSFVRRESNSNKVIMPIFFKLMAFWKIIHNAEKPKRKKRVLSAAEIYETDSTWIG